MGWVQGHTLWERGSIQVVRVLNRGFGTKNEACSLSASAFQLCNHPAALTYLPACLFAALSPPPAFNRSAWTPRGATSAPAAC